MRLPFEKVNISLKIDADKGADLLESMKMRLTSLKASSMSPMASFLLSSFMNFFFFGTDVAAEKKKMLLNIYSNVTSKKA